MGVALFAMAIAIGAIVAGVGYVRTAHAMRGYRSTIGRVVSRDVVALTADRTEGRWGSGGGYEPRITYAYSVGDREYTGDRLGYARRGLRRAIAEKQAAAIPDEVRVWFDPDDPARAYLRRHSPGLGMALVAGGVLGLACGVTYLLAR